MTLWRDACALRDVPPSCGVAALLDGRQIALVRVGEDDRVFALSNYDPFSDAFVLSRGIVGSRGDTLKVTSPVYKQAFDLRTGACLDDAAVSVDTFPVRLVDRRVQVGLA